MFGAALSEHENCVFSFHIFCFQLLKGFHSLQQHHISVKAVQMFSCSTSSLTLYGAAVFIIMNQNASDGFKLVLQSVSKGGESECFHLCLMKPLSSNDGCTLADSTDSVSACYFKIFRVKSNTV